MNGEAELALTELLERLHDLRLRATTLNAELGKIGAPASLKQEYSEVCADLAILKRIAHARRMEQNAAKEEFLEDIGLYTTAREYASVSKTMKAYVGDILELYRRWAHDELPATAAECFDELAAAIGELTSNAEPHLCKRCGLLYENVGEPYNRAYCRGCAEAINESRP